jgi:hypothetical protein
MPIDGSYHAGKAVSTREIPLRNKGFNRDWRFFLNSVIGAPFLHPFSWTGRTDSGSLWFLS